MTEIMQVMAVPLIVAIVYAIIEGYKYLVKGKEKYTYYIPIIAGITGAIIGVIAFYVSPQVMPTENVLLACLYGIVSGLSATGTNQIFKQIANKGRIDKE